MTTVRGKINISERELFSQHLRAICEQLSQAIFFRCQPTLSRTRSGGSVTAGTHRPEGPKSVDLTTPKAEEALTSLASFPRGSQLYRGASPPTVMIDEHACSRRARESQRSVRG